MPVLAYSRTFSWKIARNFWRCVWLFCFRYFSFQNTNNSSWLNLANPTSYTPLTPATTERDPVHAVSPAVWVVWDLCASTELTWRDKFSVNVPSIWASRSTARLSLCWFTLVYFNLESVVVIISKTSNFGSYRRLTAFVYLWDSGHLESAIWVCKQRVCNCLSDESLSCYHFFLRVAMAHATGDSIVIVVWQIGEYRQHA